MAAPSLRGIDLKLARAQEHLAALDEEIRAFVGDEHTLVGELDSAGLDPQDWTIIEHAQPYQAGEPWSGRDPLWLLHELNRIDKHRRVHVGYAGNIVRLLDGTRPERARLVEVPMSDPRFGDFFDAAFELTTRLEIETGYTIFVGRRDCEVERWRWANGEADDRTEIVRLTITVTGPNPEVEMQGPPAVAISLGDREVPVAIGDLFAIRDRVNEVVEGFRALF